MKSKTLVILNVTVAVLAAVFSRIYMKLGMPAMYPWVFKDTIWFLREMPTILAGMLIALILLELLVKKNIIKVVVNIIVLLIILYLGAISTVGYGWFIYWYRGH